MGVSAAAKETSGGMRMIYHSQKGQDKWVIEEVLPEYHYGFFVDIGASDGVTLSNTFVLEKMFGWTGICVEPNPKWHKDLPESRTCKIDHNVINESIDDVLWISNGTTSGIVADDCDNNYRIRNDLLTGANIEARAPITMTQLLRIHRAPRVIDYLSVDVEGAEGRVMRGFDFQNYMFKCATFERPTRELHNTLRRYGYHLKNLYRYDAFYVHNTISDGMCIQYEDVPRKEW